MSQEKLLKVILSPYLSEKAAVASDKRNEYVFKVSGCSTKPEVKDAIELLFKTKVKHVRIVNVRPKTKNFRGIEGKKKSWKKAYVTLQSDQKLDMMGAQ